MEDHLFLYCAFENLNLSLISVLIAIMVSGYKFWPTVTKRNMYLMSCMGLNMFFFIYIWKETN